MSSSKTTKALVFARELIVNPDNWIQRHLAKTAIGRIVEPTHPDASKFCCLGAILRGINFEYQGKEPANLFYEVVQRFNQVLRQWGYSPALAHFNNTQTHAKIIEVFDEVIKLAQGEDQLSNNRIVYLIPKKARLAADAPPE